MSLLLQNFHFSRKEFSDDLSNKFLETYLRKVDPSKIFFTQQDVDALADGLRAAKEQLFPTLS